PVWLALAAGVRINKDMRVIASEADIAEGLEYLAMRDRRLRRVMKRAGPVPLRRRPSGVVGLARIVVGQQVSSASAEAIWGRLERAFPDFSAAAVAAGDDATLKAVGLSGAKIKTLRSVAAATLDGLDLDALAEAPAEAAHARLTELPGIGPWTADIYLLFCLGH